MSERGAREAKQAKVIEVLMRGSRRADLDSDGQVTIKPHSSYVRKQEQICAASETFLLSFSSQTECFPLMH